MKTHWFGIAGFLLVFASLATPAFAFAEVPEIDANAAISALGLLTGGVLLITDRLRRK